jgi:hypothetical protein
MLTIIFGLINSFEEQLNYLKENAIAYKETNMPVDNAGTSSGVR